MAWFIDREGRNDLFGAGEQKVVMLSVLRSGRYFRGLLRGLMAAAVLGVFAVPALAFDGTQTPAGDPSPIQAFRSGTKAYRAGDFENATRSLEFAASRGHTMSQWQMARMYAEGKGLPRDDVKAFQLYKIIADAHWDENPDTPQARFVSSAIVALGAYYLKGVPNSDIRANPQMAFEMFKHAASYFGDSEAQYNLARFYLDGLSDVPRDPVMAARWLKSSADKGQRQAQALLGHLLLSGKELPRQPVRGLMYLSLAREGAAGEQDKWIIELHDKAISEVTDDERNAASASLKQYLTEKGR